MIGSPVLLRTCDTDGADRSAAAWPVLDHND
jgi:hypothetical protein